MTYQLPVPSYARGSGDIPSYSSTQMQQAYAAGRDDLAQAVRKVHAAKGHYHSQLAMFALYNLCDLPNDGPVK